MDSISLSLGGKNGIRCVIWFRSAEHTQRRLPGNPRPTSTVLWRLGQPRVDTVSRRTDTVGVGASPARSVPRTVRLRPADFLRLVLLLRHRLSVSAADVAVCAVRHRLHVRTGLLSSEQLRTRCRSEPHLPAKCGANRSVRKSEEQRRAGVKIPRTGQGYDSLLLLL